MPTSAHSDSSDADASDRKLLRDLMRVSNTLTSLTGHERAHFISQHQAELTQLRLVIQGVLDEDAKQADADTHADAA